MGYKSVFKGLKTKVALKKKNERFISYRAVNTLHFSIMRYGQIIAVFFSCDAHKAQNYALLTQYTIYVINGL